MNKPAVIAIVLAGAAVAKIATIESLRWSGARDVIVTAYGQSALSACQEAARASHRDGLKSGPQWSPQAGLRVEVGDRRSAVSLWQVDTQEWQMRYRRTFVVLDAADARCHFDISTGVAEVRAL